MSSWDRDAAIARYERMFRTTNDPEALMEELGTPTKIAVELARDYVPSPPPEEDAWPKPLSQSPAEQFSPAVLQPQEEKAVEESVQVQAPAPKKRSGGLAFLFWVFVLVIGIPVTLLLICVGIPVLLTGVSSIVYLVLYVPAGVMSFHLLSDVLLVTGIGLLFFAAALLASWLGIWLSLTLCRLWIEYVIVGLYRRMGA